MNIFRILEGIFKKPKCTLIQGKLTRGTRESAGYDLHCPIMISINPGQFASLPTGVKIKLKNGYEGQVRGRSGLTFNEHLLTPTGTIDSDFRGEIRVGMWNFSNKPKIIHAGSRIGQLVIVKRFDIEGADTIDAWRGDKGFGSSGTL